MSKNGILTMLNQLSMYKAIKIVRPYKKYFPIKSPQGILIFFCCEFPSSDFFPAKTLNRCLHTSICETHIEKYLGYAFLSMHLDDHGTFEISLP
jgi:hypothetical protein